MRDALKNGEVVIMPADSTEPVASGFTIGDVHVSDAAVRMAERCGAAVAFLATRAGNDGVVATITRGEMRATFERWLR